MVLPNPSENLKPSQQIGQCQEEVDVDEPPEKEPVSLVTCPSFAELWGLSQIREREIFSQQLRPNDSGQGGRSRTVDRELLLPRLFKGCESAEKPASEWNPICSLPGAQSLSLPPTPTQTIRPFP